MMLQINTLNHLTTHYKVPNLRAEGWGISTNTPSGSPYRGAGRVEAVFTMDGMLDALARATRLRCNQGLRRRGTVTTADLPYRNGMIYRDGVPIVYRAVDFVRLLDLAQERAEYDTWRRRQKDYRAAGRSIGIGISSYVEGGGLGPCEGAAVGIDESGRIRVKLGVNSQGQSHETTMAQVCAHPLGAAFDDVRVLGGDTDLMRVGSAPVPAGSRSTPATPCTTPRSRCAAKLSHWQRRFFRCPEQEITIAESSRVGHRRAAEPHHAGRTRRTGDARQAHGGFRGTRPGCNRDFLLSRNRHLGERCEYRRGRSRPRHQEYGHPQYLFVHDCGVQLNPKVVEGQIAGGFAQGLSIALGEQDVVYDGEGQLLSGSLMDYYVPRANDVPDLDPTPTSRCLRQIIR